MNNRREFLGMGLAACAAGGLSGCKSVFAPSADETVSVFISDLHVGSQDKRHAYTAGCLSKVVDEILAMRPLPKNVVCFGDIAITYGLPGDYEVSKPILKRLTDAGISLTLTMGNHDRRSAFFKAWPEAAKASLVPGRTTSVVDLGTADLVLLDTLKGTDERAFKDMGPVEGTIDAAQLAWFDDFVAKAKRPFFVGSHQYRDLYLEKSTPRAHAAKSKHFVGWIYGHDHEWSPSISVADWAKQLIFPTLALPSTGLWGDIGYVVFRTNAKGAVAELRQSDFYFSRPRPAAERPSFWDTRLADNQGLTLHFSYDK